MASSRADQCGTSTRSPSLCEVCQLSPVTVYCAADVAFLCSRCDDDIHSCNALAQRHHRVPISPPPSTSMGQSPSPIKMEPSSVKLEPAARISPGVFVQRGTPLLPCASSRLGPGPPSTEDAGGGLGPVEAGDGVPGAAAACDGSLPTGSKVPKMERNISMTTSDTRSAASGCSSAGSGKRSRSDWAINDNVLGDMGGAGAAVMNVQGRLNYVAAERRHRGVIMYGGTAIGVPVLGMPSSQQLRGNARDDGIEPATCAMLTNSEADVRRLDDGIAGQREANHRRAEGCREDSADDVLIGLRDDGCEHDLLSRPPIDPDHYSPYHHNHRHENERHRHHNHHRQHSTCAGGMETNNVDDALAMAMSQACDGEDDGDHCSTDLFSVEAEPGMCKIDSDMDLIDHMGSMDRLCALDLDEAIRGTDGDDFGMGLTDVSESVRGSCNSNSINTSSRYGVEERMMNGGALDDSRTPIDAAELSASLLESENGLSVHVKQEERDADDDGEVPVTREHGGGNAMQRCRPDHLYGDGGREEEDYMYSTPVQGHTLEDNYSNWHDHTGDHRYNHRHSHRGGDDGGGGGGGGGGGSRRVESVPLSSSSAFRSSSVDWSRHQQSSAHVTDLTCKERSEEEEPPRKQQKKTSLLRLDYEDVLSAWSGGNFWADGKRPQTVPDDSNVTDFLVNLDIGLVPDLQLGSDDVVGGEFGMVPNLLAPGEEGNTMAREARVMRYREKRRTRHFSKKIRYEVRKLNAERRPRIKGRFVKRSDCAEFS